MKKNRKNKGITLVVLVVTIVVMLILAGTSIKVASDTGIFKYARKAKEEEEKTNETNGLVEVVIMLKETNKFEQSELEKAIDKKFGQGKTTVTELENRFEIEFIGKNRYYTIDKKGNVSKPQEVVIDKNAGDITKGGTLDGSVEKPYEISCIEDLVAFSNMVNGKGIKIVNGIAEKVTSWTDFTGKYIVLTKDLNFKSKFSYANSERTDFGDINGDDTDGNALITEMTTGQGFPSIGTSISSRNFTGYFNGKNHIIEQLYIYNNTNTNQTGAGLFGKIYNASIKNITVTGKIDTVKMHTGGIAGWAYADSVIDNCHNKTSITSRSYTGGIIGQGYDNVLIINCSNSGNVTEADDADAYCSAGGIVGHSNAPTIINCYNSGNITNKKKSVYCGAGGIVGNTGNETAKVYNCYNLGKISTAHTEGTIIGGYWYNNWKSDVKKCYYLKGTSQYVIGAKVTTQEFDATECTSEQMKSDNFLNQLNSYVNEYNEENKDEEGFIKLKNWQTESNGYPTIER